MRPLSLQSSLVAVAALALSIAPMQALAQTKLRVFSGGQQDAEV